MTYCVIHITTLKLKIANKSYDKPRQHIKKQRHYFVNEGLYGQSYGFSYSHVWSWTIKKAEPRRIDAFELWYWRRLLSLPWTAKRSISQSWRKSTLNIHWKDWCWSWRSNTLDTWCEESTHWKRPWCWKDWRQEEKGTTEDEMVGWHHQLNGQEF